MRQLILSGQGDMDAAAVVIGMIVGSGFIHNFGFGQFSHGSSHGAAPALIGGPNLFGQIACVAGIFNYAGNRFTYVKNRGDYQLEKLDVRGLSCPIPVVKTRS